MKTLLKDYGESIDFKVYKAGKDFSYIKKYGFTSRSLLILDEKIKISDLSSENIEKNIKSYLERA